MDLISYALSKKPNWDDVKNKPFGETVIDIDITGMERAVNNMYSSVTEYSIDETPLQVGQKWEMYFRYKNSSKWSSQFILDVESNEKEEYIGDSNFNKCPVYVTHDKLSVNNVIFKLGLVGVKIVCIEGVKTETGIKTIDQKYLPDLNKYMTVNIIPNDDGSFSADKTFDEIFEFHNNGEIVEVLFNDVILHLVLINSDFACFSLLIPDAETYVSVIVVVINSNNEVMFREFILNTLPPTSDGDENRFLKGDGTWSNLPLSFNNNGELEVTLNGATKTFVPKE